MSSYEFMVVPAPQKVRKLTGLEKDQDKFCATITDVITDQGLNGWEFMSVEVMPQRSRIMGLFPTTRMRSCLMFRREIEQLCERTDDGVQPRRVAPSQLLPPRPTPPRAMGAKFAETRRPDNIFAAE